MTVLESSRVKAIYRRFLRTSRVVRRLRTAVRDGSVLVWSVLVVLDRWFERSSTAPVGRRIGASLLTAVRRSTAWSVLDRDEPWISMSRVYRTLAPSSESRRIVIDFREARTIGPAFATVDDLDGRRISDAVRSSAVWSVVRTLLQRVAPAVDAIRRAPVRIASLVLFAGVVVATGVAIAGGDLTATDLLVRLVLVVLAGAGTQVRRNWAELRDSVPVRLVSALLDPPYPEREAEPSDTGGVSTGSGAARSSPELADDASSAGDDY